MTTNKTALIDISYYPEWYALKKNIANNNRLIQEARAGTINDGTEFYLSVLTFAIIDDLTELSNCNFKFN